jgi:hypothetical protein
MDNDMDDWEIDVDNGEFATRILSVSDEKRLEERRMQEESDNALTEELFSSGKQMQAHAQQLPTRELQTIQKSAKLPSKKKSQTQESSKNPRLPVIPTPPPKKELSKSQKKRMEAELYGDSLYLTPEEIAGCEFEEEYYK